MWVALAWDLHLSANTLSSPSDLAAESLRGWWLTPVQSIPVSRALVHKQQEVGRGRDQAEKEALPLTQGETPCY